MSGPRSPNLNSAEARRSDLDTAQLRALEAIPSGAVVLAGVTVLLLLLAWVLIYLLVYLPRGMVG